MMLASGGVSILPAAQRDALVEINTLSDAERKLLAEVKEIENRLLLMRSIEPSQRFEVGADMERDLERLLRKVAGTKYENHAVFWLADWVFTYSGDLERTQALLERLAASPHLAHKSAGRALTVRVLLHQGRTLEAERVATSLATEIPEFMPLVTLVEFHRKVGQPAPRQTGRNLTGGPAEPIGSMPEPWLLYLFVTLSQPQERFVVEQTLNELQREEYQGRIGLVVVSFDGDPLAAMQHVAKLPGGSAAQLLWANPNDGGDADSWVVAWGLPNRPLMALVGPDRNLMAVNPPPERLRPLAGLDPDDSPASSNAPHKDLWRGKGGGKRIDR